MDKVPGRHKVKSKKSVSNAKPKTAKKRKSDGPTCSMFLSEITRRLAAKKKKEEEHEQAPNIVQSIISTIANAMPVKISRKSPERMPSPMKMETLAPELLPNNLLSIPPEYNDEEEANIVNNINEAEITINTEMNLLHEKKIKGFKMPKMPLVSSDVFKNIHRVKEPMLDKSVNTGPDHDVASELSRHVNTLRKISLIAEEFNQKTAKNLKEIVDSVQKDLIHKLEKIRESEQPPLARENVICLEGSVTSND